ncbi:MAG: glycosyltransferase family A protein [Patescibacteria group bacterium]
MTYPLVSVIITNYNYGKYLTEAVKSIAQQEYGPIELIIVDDGSDDDSRKVIEELKIKYNERFQQFSTHFLHVNQGINGALNVAINDIRGEIAVIFDADDVLDKTHLKKLVSALLEKNKIDPSIMFSYCDCYLIDEGGRKIQRGLSKPFDSKLIETESFLPRPSPIFSSVLRSFFPLPQNLSEDPKHSLWKNICKEGNKGVYVPEPLFSYRIHTENISDIGDKIRAVHRLGLADQPIYLSDYWPKSKE